MCCYAVAVVNLMCGSRFGLYLHWQLQSSGCIAAIVTVIILQASAGVIL